jgi:MFS family permease
MSATATGADLPAMSAARSRARWLHVALAAAFINTSYGTLSYSFSVLVTESGPGGEFGKGVISLGFGLALLVSGIAGLWVGTIADLFGSRRLMGFGAVAGAGGLALLAACQETWQVIAVMLLVIGPAMAATFYEPVYVLMNRWFDASERPKAYGVLTMLSGVSITIYTPLTQAFVDAWGWREATLGLAVILLVVGVLVPLALPEGERPARRQGDLSPRAFLRESWDGVLRTDARFWWFTAAFFVATMSISGYSFHMISQLETRGFDDSAVASAIAVTGLVSLPARFALPALSGRASGTTLLAICLVLLGVAAWIASMAADWWQVWVYVAVFGLVFGAVYPLRALVMSERFAGAYFGRVIGLQALFVAIARAAGPVAVTAFGTSQAGYERAFTVAAAALFLSALVTWLVMRGRPAREAAPTASPTG